MNWLNQLIHGESIAHVLFVLAVVATLGLALGSIKCKGIGLGVAGVLFSGLAIGHLGISLPEEVLDFAREFGLILFVYTIGIQVGPGFFASLRKEGLPLNLMAVSIVLFGAAITVALSKFAGISMAAAVGLFSGATTNTPSLGAAQEALRSLSGLPEGSGALPGLGYAVAYPFGIIGIILAMLMLRALFRVDLTREAADLLRKNGAKPVKLSRLNLTVTNANLNGLRLEEIPVFGSLGVVVSRILHGGNVTLAKPDDRIFLGDTLLAVGSPARLEELRLIIGTLSEIDLHAMDSNLVVRRVIVTKRAILGRQIQELDFLGDNDITVTRLTRAEVEISATPEQRIQFGDMLVLVGSEDAVARGSQALGNSVKQLNHTELIPIFTGIALGVLFGSIPIAFPGVPAPVKLGLAGGPLIIAIILSRIGRIGPLVWYMPNNANFAIREIGIVLFLACVGLHSGAKFMDTLVHGDGMKWMCCAALITMLPLLMVGLFARVILKTNYVSICGLLAGSMTDPPALAFANSISGSDGPAISYATVYPLTMLLRVVCAQLLVLVFF